MQIGKAHALLLAVSAPPVATWTLTPRMKARAFDSALRQSSQDAGQSLPSPASQNRTAPLSDILSEASAGPHKVLNGTSTRSIINAGNTTGSGYDGLVDSYFERASATGWDPKLVLARLLDSRHRLVGIGPLTMAMVIDHYEQKYGFVLGSMTQSLLEPKISDATMDKLVTGLKDGKQVGVITTSEDHQHSCFVALKLDADQKTLHAVAHDTYPQIDFAADQEFALELISEKLDVDLNFKMVQKGAVQREPSACKTMCFTIARDSLMNQSSTFPIDFQPKDRAPVAMMKVAQNPRFLRENNYDADEVYSQKLNRTLGEHRLDHTTHINGKSIFHYPVSKTISYIGAALDQLERFPDKESRDEWAREKLENAFPGNKVLEYIDQKFGNEFWN